MEESKDTKMKTFIIQEKFVGYADVTIYAETEEEAISLYNRGYYKDSNYDVDDMTYDHEFSDIREETDETVLREEEKLYLPTIREFYPNLDGMLTERIAKCIVQSIQKEQIKHLYVRQSMTLKKYSIRS